MEQDQLTLSRIRADQSLVLWAVIYGRLFFLYVHYVLVIALSVIL